MSSAIVIPLRPRNAVVTDTIRSPVEEFIPEFLTKPRLHENLSTFAEPEPGETVNRNTDASFNPPYRDKKDLGNSEQCLHSANGWRR